MAKIITFALDYKIENSHQKYKIGELIAAIDHCRHDYFMNMWIREFLNPDHQYTLSDIKFSMLFKNIAWGKRGNRTPDYITIDEQLKNVNIYEFAVTMDLKMAKLGKRDLNTDPKYTHEKSILTYAGYNVKVHIIILDLRRMLVDYTNLDIENNRLFDRSIEVYCSNYRIITNYIYKYFQEEKAMSDFVEMEFGNKILNINDEDVLPLSLGELGLIFDFQTTRDKIIKLIEIQKSKIAEQISMLNEDVAYTMTIDLEINNFIFNRDATGLEAKYLKEAIEKDNYDVLINQINQSRKDSIKRLDSELTDINAVLSNKLVISDAQKKHQLINSEYIILDTHDHSSWYENYRDYNYKNLSEKNKGFFMHYNTDEVRRFHSNVLNYSRCVLRGDIKVSSLADYVIDDKVVFDAIENFTNKYHKFNNDIMLRWKNPFKIPLIGDYKNVSKNQFNQSLFDASYGKIHSFKVGRKVCTVRSEITDPGLLKIKRKMRDERAKFGIIKRQTILRKDLNTKEKDEILRECDRLPKDCKHIDPTEYHKLKKEYETEAKKLTRTVNKEMIMLAIKENVIKELKNYDKKENTASGRGVGNTGIDYDKLYQEMLIMLNTAIGCDSSDDSVEIGTNNFHFCDTSSGPDNKLFEDLKKKSLKKVVDFDEEFMSTVFSKSLSFIWNFTQTLMFYSGIPLGSDCAIYDNCKIDDVIMIILGGRTQLKIADRQTRFYSLTIPIFDLEIYKDAPNNKPDDHKEWHKFIHNGKKYLRSPFMQMNERMLTFCISVPHKIYFLLLRDSIELEIDLMKSMKKRLFTILL